MTTRNSNQNSPITGDNHFNHSAQITPQNENISCLNYEELFQDLQLLKSSFQGINAFIDSIFLRFPLSQDLQYSLSVLRNDIDNRFDALLFANLSTR